MPRNHNTNRNGYAWTQAEISAVWQKGTVIPGYNSKEYRKDKCGKWMKFGDHGNRNAQYGWEIDHINPVSNGGGDEIGNLQPMHWSNNASKSDSLTWTCPK